MTARPAGPVDEADLVFSAEVWHWRGPSPYHFVSVPAEHVQGLRELGETVSYGWGMIPVVARTGETRWQTSLFPKGGGYVVPVKDAVRSAEAIDLGDVVTVELTVRERLRRGRPPG